MKQIIISIAFILLGLGELHAQTATPPSAGDGTSGTPYEIATLDNLYWLTQNSTEWDKYYIQTANIDASSTNVWDAGSGFSPIGNSVTAFSGSYDGQGNTIDNLFINRPLEDNVGFIGKKGGPIKNLGITNVNITGNEFVGSVVGYASGLVDNCYSSGTVTGNIRVGGLVGGIPDSRNGASTTSNSNSTCDVIGNNSVGGLVGSNGDVINNCYSTGTVTGGTGGRTGGLVGYTKYSTISSSYSTSVVTNIGDYTGGLVGYNGSTNINNCYSTGSVSGVSYVGGLVGNHETYNIINSYCIGSVSGSGSFVGGLVGDGASGGWGAKNSFWNTETTGQLISSGGIGVTTAEMHSLCMYVNGTVASWDFMFESLNGSSNVWGMNDTVNGGYPYLAWQGYTHTEECCGFIDITDPVLIVQDFALQLDNTGNAVLSPNDVVVSATDNCLISDTTLSQVNFSCSDNTITNVDVVLSDVSGNTMTQSAMITINNSASGTDIRTECDSLVWIDGKTYYSNNNVATYTIVGGAANGCDSLVTLNLTVNSVSDLSTSVSGMTITANNDFANYSWLDCDNNYSHIPGETNQSFVALTDGNYAVELTENGCVDTTSCASFITIRMLENSLSNNFVVYPNPMDGSFSIKLDENYQSVKVSVTNINGKTIQSNTHYESELITLKIEEPTGVYLLVIEADDEKAVIKLVKE